ncbi:MAG: phosphomannomutase/phosphoglucomutase [Acidobacteriota bacterium]
MSAWKACDIRGRFPEEVFPEMFQAVGAAAASELNGHGRVLVAGDFRESTPVLKAGLVDGLVRGGIQVFDGGQIPTPVAYHAHRSMDFDAVFIVTASHNPPGHNGLKFMFGQNPPDHALLTRLQQPTFHGNRVTGGSVELIDVAPAYTEWMEQRWRHLGREFSGSVVIDAGNGAWSELSPEILRGLGLAIYPLFCEVDPKFSNRPPDCARASNLAALSAKVKETGSQLGVAWDGDGDRVAFLDRNGRFIATDQISILLAQYTLGRQPRERVAYDIKLSDHVRRSIEAGGGTAIIERSGHAFLKRLMIEQSCVLGCEASGHYFHRELAGGDDGLYTALLMLELVARSGPLDALVDALPEIFITPDLRIHINGDSFDSITARLEKNLPVLQTTTLDGVRFVTAQGSVLIRRSITEAAITIRIDAGQQDGLDHLFHECCRSLPEIADEMKAQIEQSRTT